MSFVGKPAQQGYLDAPDGLFQLAAVGRDLDRRWRDLQYDNDRFATLAEEAINEIDDLDLLKVLQQHHAKLADYPFSDFNLHAFRTDRFRIEILYWLVSSTNIHEHAFRGAFKMLHGASLNVEHGFEGSRRISQDLLVGTLNVRRSRVMKKGDVHRIDCGSRFIHSNFHLGRPAITMVIRTHSERNGPQLAYLMPSIAYHHAKAGTACNRFIGVAAQITDPVFFAAMMVDQVRHATMVETVNILNNRRILLGDRGLLETLLGIVQDRHPDIAGEIAAAILEQRRRVQARNIYAQLTAVDQQFLMALLANLSDAGEISARLADEFPGQPVQALTARLLHDIGLSGALPPIPNQDVSQLSALLSGSASGDSQMAEWLRKVSVIHPLLTLDKHSHNWSSRKSGVQDVGTSFL